MVNSTAVERLDGCHIMPFGRDMNASTVNVTTERVYRGPVILINEYIGQLQLAGLLASLLLLLLFSLLYFFYPNFELKPLRRNEFGSRVVV